VIIGDSKRYCFSIPTGSPGLLKLYLSSDKGLGWKRVMSEDNSTGGIHTVRAVAPVLPPEYFPGFGLCIAMLDNPVCTVSSTFQYSRQTLQNRSRLRTPTGVQWLTVPLKSGQFGQSIGKTVIDNSVDWPAKHKKALRFNYATAPYYPHYIDEILEIILHPYKCLGELTVAATAWTHEKLGCPGRFAIDTAPDGRELVSGASDNSSSSATTRLDRSGDGFSISPYRQNFPGFEPELSFLDLILNHGPSSSEILESFISRHSPK